MQSYKNMLLYSSEWKSEKTFKMLPVDNNCPYLEVIWDSTVSILCVVAKETKETYHMLPILDKNGDIEERKIKMKDKVPYRQERRLTKTNQDYYIDEKDEVINFIDMFATNADTFDFKKYVNASAPIMATSTPPIVDLSGNTIKVVN